MSINPPVVWRLKSRRLTLGERPHLMGIVNVTPDSFSDGGQFHDVRNAVDHAKRLEDEGADLLDIGGESTRPLATPVELDEELRRVIPVIEQLQGRVSCPISVDTSKARVASDALAAGAEIVNDISGLEFDPGMIETCRELGAGVVCMHMQGTPQTMQVRPHYVDVVREIREYFQDRLADLTAGGIHPEHVVFDPGIGFGKTAEHNLEILSQVPEFRVSGRPVLIGHSRKGFLKRVLGRPVDERVFGSIGVSVAVAALGADIIRVHDVAATRDAWTAYRTVMEWQAGSLLRSGD